MAEVKPIIYSKLRYKETLTKTIAYLKELEEELWSKALGLAMTGKWKEWNKSMPEGSVMQFDWGMLSNTGDKCVDEMLAFISQVEDVRLDLMQRNNITIDENESE